MSYQPKPGSNIETILNAIPKNRAIAYDKLKEILLKNYPDFPIDSIYVHTKFLRNKNLVTIDEENGHKIFSRTGPQQNELLPAVRNTRPADYGSKPLCVLHYLQERVGKRVLSRDVQLHCGKNNKDTSPLDALKRLRDAGFIQLIPDTSPYEYLVLPDIKPLSKIPRKSNGNPTNSIIQPKTPKIEENINKTLANMSISDILSDYVRLQNENQRLKEGLQRMGMEFLQLGILEEN